MPVLAAVRVSARHGEFSDQYVVICQDAEREERPFIVWHAHYRPERDAWLADTGDYDLSWSEALGAFVKCAKLVPKDYWTWLSRNTET